MAILIDAAMFVRNMHFRVENDFDAATLHNADAIPNNNSEVARLLL